MKLYDIFASLKFDEVFDIESNFGHKFLVGYTVHCPNPYYTDVYDLPFWYYLGRYENDDVNAVYDNIFFVETLYEVKAFCESNWYGALDYRPYNGADVLKNKLKIICEKVFGADWERMYFEILKAHDLKVRGMDFKGV